MTAKPDESRARDSLRPGQPSAGVAGPKAKPNQPDLALLDAVTPQEWTREQRDLLERWRQGVLLPSCPPLLWAAPAGLDVVTGLQTAPGQAAQQWPSEAKHAIMTSQTCDIMGAGPGARFACVQVSPVLEVVGVDDDRWRRLCAFEMEDRVGLSPPGLSGRWLADLRLSFPLSKAVLLGCAPMRAFAGEAGELTFGEHLARRAGRPALHDFITGTIAPELDRTIAACKTGTAWWSRVCEVRVFIDGSRLAPTTVTLHVLVDSGRLEGDERDRWVTLSQSFAARAREHGIKVTAPWIQSLDECKAVEYRRSVPLNLPALRR